MENQKPSGFSGNHIHHHQQQQQQQQQPQYDDEQGFMPNAGQWPQPNQYAQQPQASTHDYSSYQFGAGHAPSYSLQGYSPYTPRQPPTLLTTPLPSVLVNQLSYQNTMQHPGPLQPILSNYGPNTVLPPPLPSSASSAKPAAPAPRRTLTNADRRRMCLYKRDNPMKKQTDIGLIFGVERSTVSKVWSQRARYLNIDEGAETPPIQRPRRGPDIDRALDTWATNQEREGIALTDNMLTTQARFFSSSTGGSGSDDDFTSGWLEEFKTKRATGTFRISSSRRASRSSPREQRERQRHQHHAGPQRRSTVASVPGSVMTPLTEGSSSAMSRSGSSTAQRSTASPSMSSMDYNALPVSMAPSASTTYMQSLGPEPPYLYSAASAMNTSPHSLGDSTTASPAFATSMSPYTFTSTPSQMQQILHSPLDAATSPGSQQFPSPSSSALPIGYSASSSRPSQNLPSYQSSHHRPDLSRPPQILHSSTHTLPSRPHPQHHHKHPKSPQSPQTARQNLNGLLAYLETHPGDVDEQQVAALRSLGQRWSGVGVGVGGALGVTSSFGEE